MSNSIKKKVFIVPAKWLFSSIHSFSLGFPLSVPRCLKTVAKNYTEKNGQRPKTKIFYWVYDSILWLWQYLYGGGEKEQIGGQWLNSMALNDQSDFKRVFM